MMRRRVFGTRVWEHDLRHGARTADRILADNQL
jgi:hypothetical protein